MAEQKTLAELCDEVDKAWKKLEAMQGAMREAAKIILRESYDRKVRLAAERDRRAIDAESTIERMLALKD